MDYTPDEIKKKFFELPPEVRKSMIGVDTAETIQKLGQLNGLTVERTGKLAEEIGYVMLGIKRPIQFVDNLVKALEIPPPVAQKLAQGINDQIFSPIREALIKVNGVSDLKLWREHEEIANGQISKVPTKTEILSGIEDKHEELPAIFSGLTMPKAMEDKMTQEIFRAPAQTTDQSPVLADPFAEIEAIKTETQSAPAPIVDTAKYPDKDPYREMPDDVKL